MPGLKEVRIRIASVKSTQQITNAMKMVAASKLRRAQNAILKLRPYAAKAAGDHAEPECEHRRFQRKHLFR